MIRDHFRVLVVDLSTGRGKVTVLEGRETVGGGSGLAAMLFEIYGKTDRTWEDPDQPLIFAIGPLTGYFPLMSKTVCAFKSPYHDQYAESHGGGRSALSMRFADLDALVITGKAQRPSLLSVGSRHLDVKEVHYLWGMDIHATGKMLRHMSGGSGHRSILRIGPAGERGSAMACINVDTFRHFGRLGGGGVMGSKNLKAIVIQGDGVFPLVQNKDYLRLFEEVYKQVTATDHMKKYHNLGTAENVSVLNQLRALPIQNLRRTSDQAVEGITGERFARDTLLRNSACSGCPVGCIHVGFVRERFNNGSDFLYRQVSYDFEPIFAAGAMLGVFDCFAVLALLDTIEKAGLDAMSAGVALAWATEALEQGILTEKETLAPIRFGDAEQYKEALHHLAFGTNEFYRILARGTMRAASHFGGTEFACCLGQEMAGYATGEVFLVSQALGLRHSHLDAAGYSYDQKQKNRNVMDAVDFILRDERERSFLTSMVACLFSRNVYTMKVLSDCLDSVGYRGLAGDIETVSSRIQKMRWKMRLSTGFDPKAVSIPRRFTEIATWKGNVDENYLQSLKTELSERIIQMGA